MKKYIHKILALFLLMLLVSCEVAVEPKLNSVSPRLVIDAGISENEYCTVNLIKSQDFFNNAPFQRVSNAVITLTDSEGNSETLSEISAGLYQSKMKGIVNKEYRINVKADNNSYDARATIPPLVPIDSMYIFNIRIGTTDNFSPAIMYKDPAGVDNFYYSRITANGRLMRTVYLDSDLNQDGRVITNILPFNSADNNDEELKIGDKVMVNLQMLDKAAHTYFSSVFSMSAGRSSNPPSNFSNGVLGCFKAYNSTTKEITIAESNIFTR